MDREPGAEHRWSVISGPVYLRVGGYETLVAPIKNQGLLRTTRLLAYSPSTGQGGGELREFQGVKLNKGPNDTFTFYGNAETKKVLEIPEKKEWRLSPSIEKLTLDPSENTSFKLKIGANVMVSAEIKNGKLNLLAVNGNKKLQKDFSPGEIINIGATKGNFIVDERTVSGSHATLIYTGDTILMRDNKSSNGTILERELDTGHEGKSYTIPSPERSVQTNEDAVVVNQRAGFVAVCDGVGSQEDSGVVSHYLTRRLEAELGGQNSDVEDVKSRIKRAISDTQEMIRNGGLESSTTLTCGVIIKDEDHLRLVLFQAGDSRLYGIKKDGVVEQLSTDHNYTYRQFRTDKITLREYRTISKTLDNATSMDELVKLGEHFEKRHHIYESVAEDRPPNPDSCFKTFDLLPDTLAVLLTTDGVTDNLTLSQVANLVREQVINGDPENIPEILCESARNPRTVARARQKRDDTTAAILFV